MIYLIEALLFLSPFALYAIWLRLRPGRTVATPVIVLAALGVAIAAGGAAWYGLSRGGTPTTAYAPTHLGPDPDASPRPVPPVRAP